MKAHPLHSRLFRYGMRALLVWALLFLMSCTFLPFPWGAQSPPQSPLQIEAIRILDEPLVGQPFRVEIPIVWHAQVPLSPVILTLTIPSSLQFVGLESEGQVIRQRETLIHLPDPVGWGGIETKGYVVSINLGTLGGEGGETAKKTVILVMEAVASGEWQIEGAVMWRDSDTKNAMGDIKRVVGWSTPSRAVWENFRTVERRWLQEEGRQCGGGAPCLVVYPEEPFHYFLGISEEAMPGQLLRPRAAKMCDGSLDLTPCLEQDAPFRSPTPESGRSLPRLTRTPTTSTLFSLAGVASSDEDP